MEAAPGTAGPVRFGRFELDMRARELRSGTLVVRLQDQPFEILCTMLERPGDVVTREELRRRLWPVGTYVDFEHSLNAAVKRLRAALGDDAENQSFVETLPRRGYRFIASLSAAAVDHGGARTSASRGKTRVAVLPFRDLGDERHEYFADGLTEELIAQLGGVGRNQIAVVARWSSMVFKNTGLRIRDIGEALRADYLLEGSVRREGERIRVTAHLVAAADEVQLWSESYDRHMTDVLAVQSDVAARIARSLAAELMPAEIHRVAPACDPAAYQTYLKGRYYWNKRADEGLDQALAYYADTLAVAPAYGPAHAAMARARLSQAEYYRDVPIRALRAAQASAARALEIDDRLYEAHIALADARRMLDWDWDGSSDAYRLAISLNPSFENAHRGYAHVLSVLGRHEQAIRAAERACELDPLCLAVGTAAAWITYAAGDYDASIQLSRNTLDMDPEFTPVRRMLGAAYLMAGQPEAGIAEFESALEAGGEDPVLLAWLAHARAVTGSVRQAESWLARIGVLGKDRYVSGYHLAVALVGLGRIDDAFAALDTAWLDRDPALARIVVEPRLAPLRSDRRFAALLDRVKLSPASVRA
jgi:TolB-like protein